MTDIILTKKVNATISDENGYEIFMICDLNQVIIESELDEDGIRVPVKFYYEVGHIYDIVLQYMAGSFISIYDKVDKNAELLNKMIESVLENADDLFND